MLAASRERILREVPDDALVLDVGGWAKPFPRADWVLDLCPYETRGLYGSEPGGKERFGHDTWVQRDICAAEPFPFADGQFDFVVCSHTLEDVRDPVRVCAEIARVGKAGYIETPSRLEEQSYGIAGAWVGWSHHRWLVEVAEGRIEFVFKPHAVHGRVSNRFPDGFHRTLSPQERIETLWWSGSFEFGERVIPTAEELDDYLASFVARELAARSLSRRPRATAPTARAPAEAVAANKGWYHTIELAPGVVTPGQIDLRGLPEKLLPGSLEGRRALDVGTFDGFWAFELERRGAETVAIDVPAIDAAEWPPVHRERLKAAAREWDLELGRGFRLAAEALRSTVERIECPIADLAPERIGGPVDFAFSGAILLHLRDPVGALERIHSALAPGGELVILEPFSVASTLRSPRAPAAEFQPLATSFNWWLPNLVALRDWLTTAGFVEVERRGFHRAPAERRMRQWQVALRAVRH